MRLKDFVNFEPCNVCEFIWNEVKHCMAFCTRISRNCVTCLETFREHGTHCMFVSHHKLQTVVARFDEEYFSDRVF